MARLHSKKHGKSGRKRVKPKVPPEWLEYSKEEVEKIIIDLAKKGSQPTTIGLILRDKYGIPMAKPIIGKTISKFLEEQKLLPKYPDNLINLIKKAVRMRDHLAKNKTDIHNKVKLSHVESKIRRLVKYYKRKGKLPADWKYDPNTAALLIR